MRSQRGMKILTAALLSVLLSACGGGGLGMSTTGGGTTVPPGGLASLGVQVLSDNVRANGASTSTVRVIALDSSNNPISGQPVVLITTAGDVTNSPLATNASGIADFVVTAPTVTGTATVTATSGGFSVTSTITFIAGPVDEIIVTATPGSISVGGTASVIAFLRDAFGNPVPNQTVTLSFVGTAVGSLSSLVVTSGTSGQATTTYTAPPSISTSSTTAAIRARVSTVVANATNAVITITTPPGAASPGNVDVLASGASVRTGSTSANGVTVSAIVRDTLNNLMLNVPVTFSVANPAMAVCGNGGALQVINGNTDNTGTATAVVSAGGSQDSQILMVTATAGGQSDTVTLPVTGTQVVIASQSGEASVTSGDTINFVASVVNSANVKRPNTPIQIRSALGNQVNGTAATAMAPVTVMTDATGNAVFTYTAVTGGNETLSGSTAPANACADAGSLSFAVAATKFGFTTPVQSGVQVPLGNAGASIQPLQLLYTVNGVGQANQRIDFSTTRGSLSNTCYTTFANGTLTIDGTDTGMAQDCAAVPAPQAALTINQPVGVGGAGTGLITATVRGGGPVATRSINFISRTPAILDLQAQPENISINNSSQIVATVRDTDNNLVTGARINFTLSDVSGGGLSASTGITDTSGNLAITYNASGVASARNGVSITGQVIDPDTNVVAATDIVTLSVGGLGLRITLGTGNSIVDNNGLSTYDLPYTVLVTDSSGNPPPSGTTVGLSVFGLAYQKGNYDPASAPTWVPIYRAVNNVGVLALSPLPDLFGCKNEDANLNGVLNPGEDDNTNGTLDPSAAVSVPASVALGSNGFGNFLLTYPKDRANWLQIRLTATAAVAGTEAVTSQDIILPLSAEDAEVTNGSPPGSNSPYGLGITSMGDCNTPN